MGHPGIEREETPVGACGGGSSPGGVPAEAGHCCLPVLPRGSPARHSVGGPSGLFSRERRFPWRHWGAAAAGASLFPAGLLVPPGPPAAAVAWIPFVEVAHPGWVVFGLVLLLAAASATQDVAIDSYTVGLVDPEEQGAANGIRASAYRVALVLVGGVLLVFTPLIGWTALFLTAAGLLVGLAMAAPRVPRLDLPPQARRAWKAGVLTWGGTWRAGPLI